MFLWGKAVKEYREVSFPKTRIATLDVLEIGRKKHHIKALLELDVTNARSLIKEYRSATNNKLSFKAWLHTFTCCGQDHRRVSICRWPQLPMLLIVFYKLKYL